MRGGYPPFEFGYSLQSPEKSTFFLVFFCSSRKQFFYFGKHKVLVFFTSCNIRYLFLSASKKSVEMAQATCTSSKKMSNTNWYVIFLPEASKSNLVMLFKEREFFIFHTTETSFAPRKENDFWLGWLLEYRRVSFTTFKSGRKRVSRNVLIGCCYINRKYVVKSLRVVRKKYWDFLKNDNESINSTLFYILLIILFLFPNFIDFEEQ